MKKQITTRTINDGVSFLAKTQAPDGGFASFSSPSCEKFTGEKIYHSTFPAALILSCLNEVDGAGASAIKEKLAKFLLAQKSDNWTFNYWARDAEENLKMPYPDDLDDTFCALAALFKHKPSSVNTKALAKIISMLTFMEHKEGGPYRTWLTPPEAPRKWADVDLAVNANVGYFLSLHNVSLPGILSFIEKAIDEANYTSPYYPSEYPVIYFISRFYTGTKTEKMREFLFQKQSENGAFGNPLETALAVSALLRFGAEPKKLEKSILYLKKSQKNGSFDADAFCLDPAIQGQAYYAGSSALSTAFCVEALALYEKKSAKRDSVKALNKTTDAARETVAKEAKKKFLALDAELQKEALARLDKTLLGDRDGSIVLLPYFFSRSLGKNAEKIPHGLIVSLCLANLYGWIAYTIYDDFLDDEGDPKLLSIANVCLRELTEIFLRIGDKYPAFSKIFTETMDTLDSANAWEVANCRAKNARAIPNYENGTRLAERSLGHALGPIAIFCALGFGAKSPELKNLKKLFEEYLIARQLNDDAHDWEEDLRAGHVNAIGAKLLRDSGKETLQEKFSEDEILAMQKIFWDKTINAAAADILAHAANARKLLRKIPAIKDPSFFEHIIAPLENSAKEALAEKERALDFLKAY
jgi:hypothetical protein